MQINRIQNNYTPQFQGIMKIQNLAGKNFEIKTTHELDRGFAKITLTDIFDGSWSNEGIKEVSRKKFSPFIEAMRLTLDVNLHKIFKDAKTAELKHFDNGYSIKTDNGCKLTHIREDQLIWD